jgi:hypothetical protein
MILDVVPGLVVVLAFTATLFVTGVGVGLLVGRLRMQEPDTARATSRDEAPAGPSPAAASDLVLWPHLRETSATRAWDRSA